MASVCPHPAYISSDISISYKCHHGTGVQNSRAGCNGSFFDRKIEFCNNLCFSNKSKNRRASFFSNLAESHSFVLTVRCDGSIDPESSFDLAQHQLEVSQNFSERAWSRTDSTNSRTKNQVDQQLFAELSGGDGNGSGDGGRFDSNGGGDNEGGDDNPSEEEKEYGRLLNLDEVNAQVREHGVTLPSDMAEYARTVGIRSLILNRFIELQAAKWPLGAAIRCSTAFRNRMLADQSFLFKILTEIAIDSGCATVAEVQKRGKDFWNEFELYMADLVVGVVVDVALVSMLAPAVQFRRPISATGIMARFSHAIQSLPSSVFEAATPGRAFSIQQRIGSYFYKGLQYGAVGFGCGIIGQGIANSIMLLKRKVKKSDSDVPVPPLVKSAALWGFFLAVSSNTRYQVVNGLERVVEGSALAKRLPVIAMAFTVCIRFGNNTYGGMQFVDWARWSGVQ